MSWASAMNDLASSWKVGIAFLILVALRMVLVSQSATLESARALIFGGLAGVFKAPRRRVPSGRGDAGPSDADPSPADEMRRSALEFVDSGLIALVLVFMLIRPFVVQAFYIPSASMQPTLLEDDKILVNKFIYRFREPHRGDVVVFRSPPAASADQKDYIKRLVGLPGDEIEVRPGVVDNHGETVPAGILYRNGKPVEEAYTKEPMDPYRVYGPVKVEPGKVLVMGDNRNNSHDGRYWGQLDMGRIRGKAMVIFWPPGRMGLIR